MRSFNKLSAYTVFTRPRQKHAVRSLKCLPLLSYNLHRPRLNQRCGKTLDLKYFTMLKGKERCKRNRNLSTLFLGTMTRIMYRIGALVLRYISYSKKRYRCSPIQFHIRSNAGI